MKKTPKKENNKSIRKLIALDEKEIKDKNPDCFTILPPKEFIPVKELYRRPAYFYSNGYTLPYFIQFNDEVPYNVRISSSLLTLLRHLKLYFEEDENPVYVIEAFTVAHQAGVYPPMWVLDYVVEVFKIYFKAQGKGRLDYFFSLDTDRGQRPIFETLIRGEFHYMLCDKVFLLNSFFKFSIKNACILVTETLKRTPNFNKSRYKIKVPSAETLKIMYKRKWSKYFKNTPNKDEMSINSAIQFLNLFKWNYSILNKDKRHILDLIYFVNSRQPPYFQKRKRIQNFLKDKGLL